MIDPQTKDQIKQRVSVRQLLESYGAHFRRSGRNQAARCIFHVEDSPSLIVWPDDASFNCFGCGKTGDAFSLLEDKEGLTFMEAARRLAGLAGVELPEADRRLSEAQAARARLVELNKQAQSYFFFKLRHPKAQSVRDYLYSERGILPETAEKFGLGYAPGHSQDLFDELKNQGFGWGEMMSAGLVRREHEAIYQYRVMFPIRDRRGEVIGFAGRKTAIPQNEAAPKYLNTPATPAFHKGSTLYGLDLAWREIKNAGYAILVEGQLDVVLCHQAGYPQAVATMGTALTAEHLAQLSRVAGKLIIATDGDAAGRKAVDRASELLRAGASFGSFELQVAELPEGHDPASLLRENPALFKTALEMALPLLDYHMTLAMTSHNLATAAGKVEVVDYMLPLIKELSDGVVREHYLRELAGYTETSFTTLANRVTQVVVSRSRLEAIKPPSAAIAVSSAPDRTPRGFKFERALLRLLYAHFPQSLEVAAADECEVTEDDFRDDFHRMVFMTLARARAEGADPDEAAEAAGDPAFTADYFALKAEALEGEHVAGGFDITEAVRQGLHKVRHYRFNRLYEALVRAMEDPGVDDDDLDHLMNRAVELRDRQELYA